MNSIIDRDEFKSIGSIAAKIVGGLASERTYEGGKITEAGV